MATILVEEEILSLREADEKGTAGSREHPVDVQIRELKLKAKLVQQKFEIRVGA
jgi:hypothetical protein